MTKDDKGELVARIESSKSDMIKWMLIFWIGQLGATAGIVFASLNAYLKKQQGKKTYSYLPNKKALRKLNVGRL